MSTGTVLFDNFCLLNDPAIYSAETYRLPTVLLRQCSQSTRQGEGEPLLEVMLSTRTVPLTRFAPGRAQQVPPSVVGVCYHPCAGGVYDPGYISLRVPQIVVIRIVVLYTR